MSWGLDAVFRALIERFDPPCGTLPSPAPEMVLPTGLPVLDELLGIGGFPRGRLVVITGTPSSDRTTLALGTAVRTQEDGGNVAVLDLEGSLLARDLVTFGLNARTTIIGRPKCGEEALSWSIALAGSSAVDLLVLHTAASMLSRAELEAPLGGPCPPSDEGLRLALLELARRVRRAGSVVLLIDERRSYLRGRWTPYAAVGVEVRAIAARDMSSSPQNPRVVLEVFKNPWMSRPLSLEVTLHGTCGRNRSRRPEVDHCADLMGDGR